MTLTREKVFPVVFAVIAVLLVVLFVKWITINERAVATATLEYYEEGNVVCADVQIDDADFKKIIKIVNRSRLKFFESIFIKYKVVVSYVVRIHYKNGKADTLYFWDESEAFKFRGWHVIRKKDREELHNLLQTIRMNSQS